MGTRIHKVIGWGFKYTKLAKDPRFNESLFDGNRAVLDEMVELNNTKLNSKDIRVRMDANSFDMRVKARGMYCNEKPIHHLDVCEFVNYNGYLDYEKDNGTLLITDPTNKKWSRYDDIIDYYESNGTEDNVKYILDGAGQPAQLYPYCSFVDRNTGKRPKMKKGVSISQSDRWSLTEAYFEWTKDERKKWNWKVFGVKNILEWQRNIVPEPPYNIRLFCETIKAFKNKKTVYRLKPMIFTYWC
jgi:hypothetical protein